VDVATENRWTVNMRRSIEWSSCGVLPRQAKRLDGASMRDLSLNLPQGEISSLNKSTPGSTGVNGLFKFIASITYVRFSRSSTLPRYYSFGLSKSRNNSSLINLQHRGKPASGQNPYVISTSWLFRRINPLTPGLEPSTFPTCMS
jgi:hypothetical protein